jgi:hypothetical protein
LSAKSTTDGYPACWPTGRRDHALRPRVLRCPARARRQHTAPAHSTRRIVQDSLPLVHRGGTSLTNFGHLSFKHYGEVRRVRRCGFVLVAQTTESSRRPILF